MLYFTLLQPFFLLEGWDENNAGCVSQRQKAGREEQDAAGGQRYPGSDTQIPAEPEVLACSANKPSIHSCAFKSEALIQQWLKP